MVPIDITSFRKRVYIQIRHHWLSARVVSPNGVSSQFQGLARVVVDPRVKGFFGASALGDDATGAFEYDHGMRVIDAFTHPRVIVANWDNAQIVLYYFLLKANGGRRLFSFNLVAQVLDNLEGGLTDVESRALKQLTLTCGARMCMLETSQRELSNKEILTYPFK